MAKMFYTMDEAAEKLGVSTDKLKEMAEAGQLNQFRDRDKVMFKVDQVDKLAPETGAGGGDASGDTGTIGFADDTAGGTAGGTDEIDLASAVEEDHSKPAAQQDRRQETGVSVFDADEVDAADPLAQTVVSDSPVSDDDELALESVGSGSGLLDLTRESDDTSLGAELLEEIYPSSGATEGEESEGGEGIFEPSSTAAGSTGIGDIEAPAEAEPAAAGGGAVTVVEAEPRDPTGSGWTAGLLIGALVALTVGMLTMVSTMTGAQLPLLDQLAANAPLYAGALLGGSLVLALLGGVIGKMVGR